MSCALNLTRTSSFLIVSQISWVLQAWTYSDLVSYFLEQWAPYHAIMATPLFVSFELLLCLYLDRTYGMQEMNILFCSLSTKWLVFHGFASCSRWKLFEGIIAPILIFFLLPDISWFNFIDLYMLEDWLTCSANLKYATVVDLKILFLPILAFEIAVLVDNIRYFSFNW